MRFQSCQTLRDPMDCNLSGLSVHRLLQARILRWFAISYSGGSSWLTSPVSPALAGKFFTTAPPRNPLPYIKSPDLVYDCKFVSFNHLHPFHLPCQSSALATTDLFSVSEFVCFYSICKCSHLPLSIWLFSLNIIHLRPIPVVTDGRISLFGGWIIYIFIYLTFYLSAHLSMYT